MGAAAQQPTAPEHILTAQARLALPAHLPSVLPLPVHLLSVLALPAHLVSKWVPGVQLHSASAPDLCSGTYQLLLLPHSSKALSDPSALGEGPPEEQAPKCYTPQQKTFKLPCTKGAGSKQCCAPHQQTLMLPRVRCAAQVAAAQQRGAEGPDGARHELPHLRRRPCV